MVGVLLMISNYSFLYVSILSFFEKVLGFLKFPDFINARLYNSKNKYILKKLEGIHRDILKKYSKPSLHHGSNVDDNVIWVCWLQGEIQAPELVKRCINNLREYNEPEYRVVVIDLDNYYEYASVSEVIMDKYRKGIITNTHFSDILRFNLLMRHGGLWIDATYLTLNKLPDLILGKDFFTLASNVYASRFVPMGRWSGNFMKFSKESFVPALMYDLFVDYWNKNSELIDYFLIDYYLELIYCNFPSFKEQIDANIKLGDNCFLMSNFLFDEFSDYINNKIINDEIKIYKLSYKNSADKLSRINTFYHKYIKSGCS